MRIPRSITLSLGFGLVVMLPLACGKDPAGPGGYSGNVTIESGRAASATVGPEGGTLEATASNGTHYRLTVPASALPMAQAITMTPVTDIANLPVSGAFVGSVDLQPAGLHFARPATLTIEATASPGSGQIPIALNSNADAGAFALDFVQSAPGAWSVAVSHFSQETVGFGTIQDVATIATATGDQFQSLAAQILDASSAQPPNMENVRQLIIDLFDQVVLPNLQDADTDQQLTAAMAQLGVWNSIPQIIGCGCGDFSTQLAQARLDLAPRLRAAIAGNNAIGAAEQSFAALANVLFWQQQAEEWGVATLENLLDRNTILRDLCAHPVVESVTLPDDLQVGFPHSLDATFGLRFTGHDPIGAPFKVSVTASGATVQDQDGCTNEQGNFTTIVTASSGSPVTVDVTALLVLPDAAGRARTCEEAPATAVRVTTEVTRTPLDLTATWIGTVSCTVAASSGPQSFTLPFRMTIDQNQNAIHGDWDAACGEYSGPLLATLASGGELSGVQFIDAPLGQCVGNYTGTGSATTSTITIDVSGVGTCDDGEGSQGSAQVTAHLSLTRGGADPCGSK